MSRMKLTYLNRIIVLASRLMVSIISINKLLAILAATFALTASAQVPGYIGRYESSRKDSDAIMQVTKDFQAALFGKDARKLSSLLVNSRILFSSPASPAGSRKRREKTDISFDGIDQAGAPAFLDFIAKSIEPVEEKFYNIRITQDGHIAWVMFDFEFLQANKVENYGLEVWQLLKTDDSTWKIMSVVWSSRGSPK